MQDYTSYQNPLTGRYASREMSYNWSPQRKHSTWRRLWLALAESEKELGLNITDEQLDELRETLELQEFYVPKHDAQRINTMDSKFHQLIYRFSGSIALYDTLMPLHKKVLKYRLASVENDVRSSHSSQEHRAIFEAIAAHDAELAEKYMVEHIANAKAHIQKRGIN